MGQIADAALAAWRFPWGTGLSLLAIAALYLRGFMRVHRQMPARVAMRERIRLNLEPIPSYSACRIACFGPPAKTTGASATDRKWLDPARGIAL